MLDENTDFDFGKVLGIINRTFARGGLVGVAKPEKNPSNLIRESGTGRIDLRREAVVTTGFDFVNRFH